MASGPVHALGVSGSRYWSSFLSFPSAHINFFSVFSFSKKYFAQASAFKGLPTRKLEHQKQTTLSEIRPAIPTSLHQEGLLSHF